MNFGRKRNALLCSAFLFAAASLAQAQAQPAGHEAGPAASAVRDLAQPTAAPTDVSARRKHRTRAHRASRPHQGRVSPRRSARLVHARPQTAFANAQPQSPFVNAHPRVDLHGADGTSGASSVAPQAVSARAMSRASRRAAAQSGADAFASFGGGNVVAEARRHIGGNPTGRSSLWCATFMNMVLERAGHRGTGSNLARSFAAYGQRVSGPQVGAIAVMSRGRRGGHVGVVSGIDASGNPIIISGNHNRRVAEAVYPRGRIYAYVMPN